MGKKRQSEDTAEGNTPAKKDKFPEFNGTVFKSMLKNPAQAFKGLEKFTSTAKKLPCSDLYDVVEGYIKISMECAEIFKLLEVERHAESELMLIYESLEMILLRTASDLTHFNTVGNAIVTKTVSSHMKSLLGSLQSSNHRFVRQCLSFLSALVAQGPEAAREVFSHIHAYKALSGLARRKDKQGKPDVRMAFIQFVLSFLVSGDNATIGQILEVKEFLPEILSTGLKEDRLSIVNLILSTLKSRVVLNKGISKTQKVRFFTAAVLTNLASLYKWNGIVDAATEDDSMEEESPQSGAALVRELAHSFLVDLCCSRKHGISFHDASFGTAGRAGNLVLLQFLVGLRQAPDDELVSELLVNVLKASPDLLSRYFKETQHSYTPRLKSAWQDNVNLMKKIYEAQPDISCVFQSQEVVPTARLLSMINVLSLPPVCSKAFFTQGLNLPSTAVQLTTFSVMNFLLKRALRNLQYLLEKAESGSGDVTSELEQQYRESLSKILPDMTTIVGKWMSLGKKDKEETKTADESKGEAGDAQAQVPETAEVILLKALILQVVCLYQKVVPHLVAQCKFDFSKLLKGILSEKGIKEEVPPVLQYHILQLALELPSTKFSWFRLQETADGECSSSEKSVLYQILNMFVSSSTSHLKTSTKKLVLKVLKDSGVFEYTWTELELWLDQLTALETSQREAVIHFLEKVLVKLVSTSHVYTDRVASLVQEAAYLQANLSGQDGDAASVPVSHIDDVLDMLDVIMESSEGEMEEFGPPLSEELILQTFPFSALVPAALEARNKLSPGKDVVFEYLSCVLLDVLHSQRDPLPLCLALLQYDKELQASGSSPHPSVVLLQQYYTKWLPPQSIEELLKPMEVQTHLQQSPATFTNKLKEAYVQGPSALNKEELVQTLGDTLESMSLAEIPVSIKQTLLYIRSTVEDFGKFSKDSGKAVLENLMKILQLLVTKVLQLHEAPSEPAAETPQDGSELFLETGQSSDGDEDKEQVLLSSLSTVLKHPSLQQWFLSLELGALPPHSLKPVRLKQLCSLMTEHIIPLLELVAPRIPNHQRDLLKHFCDAIVKAVLKELTDTRAPANTQSCPMRALLSLHNFMDFSDVKEVVSALLLLPQDSLFCTSEGATELSVFGQAALQILTQSTASESVFLSQAHLSGLGTLLLSCSSPELEAFLLQTLTKEPGSAKLIHTKVLLHCLHQERTESQSIVCLLLQNCSAHRLRFEKWTLEPENMEVLVNKMDTYLPLVKTYLGLGTKEDPARPKDVKEQVLKKMKQTLLPKLSHFVLGNLPENSGVDLVETLSSLIKLCADVKDIKELCTSLPDALKTPATLERWRLVDVVTEKLTESPEESESWRKSVLSAALVCLKASYSQFRDPEASRAELEQSVLLSLQSRLTSADDIPPSDWNSFVKTGLKYRYREASFLTSLCSLVELMYGGPEPRPELLPLATLHMMSSSHSLFLPSLLGSGEDGTPQSKEALVSLLLSLVKKCPSVCNTNHFVVLLGAYGASLGTSDQKLLLLLQEYERNNVSLLKFQSLVWGPAAVEHHKAKKSLGSSLWKQTSTEELLALLTPDRMVHSIKHFPQQRRLISQDDEPLFQTDTVKDLQNVYDPRFLLPLFSAILRPESVVDCLKFVSSHALGFTAAALSSYDPKTRAAAYHVLTCFYQHLEGARFKEKNQLLYLVDMVKNSVRQKNQRLPFILSLYVSKVVQQMLKPEDHMYVVINRFLLSHQSLDFRRVPEFFKLFYGFDLEHKLERDWILSVLEEGISDRYCYELCEQQGVFQSLLGFCSSPLCDDGTQAQILRVLSRAARVTQAAYNLSKGCGLLSWVIQLLDKRKLDQLLLGAIVELVHTLWATNLGQKEKQLDHLSSLSPEDKPERPVKCLPLPLVCEFISVASAITKHLRLCVKACHFSLFLETYSSVLNHYAASVDMSTQAGRLTLLPEPLSCADALSLLLCCARLHHNNQLLTEVERLAEKHQLRLLLATGKDKVRLKGLMSQRQRPPVDSGPEEAPPSSEWPVSLCSVLCRWTPASSSCRDQTPPRPGHGTEPGELAKDTALLLAKWSLRSLLDGPRSGPRQRGFLLWLQSIVLGHAAIVDALVLDGSVTADLLRLYHQAFEASAADVKDLRLLTEVMVRLSERRGPLPPEHRAVVSSCLPEETAPRPTHDAGLSLLSLYIHELWSGVPSPELFMSHVRTVTRDTGGKRKVECPVRAVCSDVITATTE